MGYLIVLQFPVLTLNWQVEQLQPNKAMLIMGLAHSAMKILFTSLRKKKNQAVEVIAKCEGNLEGMTEEKDAISINWSARVYNLLY